MFAHEFHHRRARPGRGGYSMESRDAQHITCHATGCTFNIGQSCAVPSRCKIKADGGCSGFEAKPLPPGKQGD